MAGLASSLRLGNVNLKHRAVMSPMTRIRADDQHVPLGRHIQWFPVAIFLWRNQGPFLNPSENQIPDWINNYAQAAKNAIAAGFNRVEIHGANGYFVENRSRFGLEVAQAVANAIGAERTGYWISPWSTFQGMRMKSLHEQFSHFVQGLSELNLAFLDIVEPCISGSTTIEAADEDNTFLLDAFGNSGFIILARDFMGPSADEKIKSHPNHRITIAFGRHFLANPDLSFRLSKSLHLNLYHRPTFYTPKSPVGYLDYPFSLQFLSTGGAEVSG